MNKKNIILASASPRRIEIMKNHGFSPIVLPAAVDESLPDSLGMEESVMFLALKKALFTEQKNEVKELDNPYIFAADTIVFKDKIIGKPKDREDAFNILWELNGKSHYVATGVCILGANTSLRHCFCEVTKVFFKSFTKEELNAYLDTDEPYDKAGAYAIQGIFGKYVDRIEGDLENVIGFPWKRIETELKSLELIL